MSYESSSFSRSSSSSSSTDDGSKRRRKVRKKRRKTMTADDMRKGVTFQTGLTGKAKLALLGVIVAGIAITIVVMMAVNGSFSLKALSNENEASQPLNSGDGSDLDAFAPDNGQGLPQATPTSGETSTGQTDDLEAPSTPADDISNAFEE